MPEWLIGFPIAGVGIAFGIAIYFMMKSPIEKNENRGGQL